MVLKEMLGRNSENSAPTVYLMTFYCFLIKSFADGSKETFAGNFASDSNQQQYVNKVVVPKKSGFYF